MGLRSGSPWFGTALGALLIAAACGTPDEAPPAPVQDEAPDSEQEALVEVPVLPVFRDGAEPPPESIDTGPTVPDTPPPDLPESLPNLPLPTFGGLQYWSDVDLREGWRIQQHAITTHHRLLDDDDVRRAWGSRAACARELERIGPARETRTEVVLMVNGLGRTHHALAGLETSLQENGHHTEHLRYATTQLSVRVHAEHLADWLDTLGHVERVSFVTHSLGGHVVRDALSYREPGPDRPAIGSVIMLAPPSQGASMADLVGGIAPAHWVFGPALQDLTTEASAELPVPEAPFGIIAAGRGTEDGLNPFIPGDDDGVVGVDEAILPGAADVLVVHGSHTFLMDDEEVRAAVDQFLRTGSFGER